MDAGADDGGANGLSALLAADASQLGGTGDGPAEQDAKIVERLQVGASLIDGPTAVM